MHIADGILPVGACAGAYAVSLAGVYASSRKVGTAEMSRMGLLAAAAFTASLIHFPLAGTSVHLGLFGLLGIVLRSRAFPVVFAALLFQSLLFQHGGLLSLGVNSLNMGVGAVCGWLIWSIGSLPDGVRGFAAGFLGVWIPALLMATEFALSGYGRGFFFIAGIYAVAAALEGALTAAIVGFLRRAKPEVLQQAHA